MASSVMHLAVIHELIRQHTFHDISRLTFGVILPDAGQDKAGHLNRYVWGRNKKTYDFERFRSEFGELMKMDDLYVGYYLHLIQDICYRHLVYDKYKWDPMIPGNIEKLHRDYSVINPYLISRYHISPDLAVPDQFEKEAICGLCAYDTDRLMASMASYWKPVDESDAFFLTKDMADEFVAEATSVCLRELNALKEGAGFIDSYDSAWDNQPYSLLETTLNTRDLGGYRVDGSDAYTMCGRLIRSDVANHPSEQDVAFLKSSGITTIIDVRSAEEKERKPHGLSRADGFDYRDIPIVEGSGVPESLEALADSYYGIAHADNIREVFRTIAEAEGGVLFGCTAGKDRTGLIAALLLWLCGVRKSDIVYDYMRTKVNNWERFALIHQKYPEIDMNIVIPNERNMIRFMKRIEDAYGTVERYFSSIGIDDQQQKKIKTHLLPDLVNG